MKTIIKFILASFMMLLVVSALGQQQVPLIQKGEKTSILFNKKGNKKLDVEILNVIYSDSTQYSCNVEIKLQLTAIGKKISLFRHVLLENSYYPRLTFSDNINHVEKLANELADGESTTFTIKVYLEDKFFILFDNLYVMRLDQYEGGEIIRQREEEKERLMKRQEEIKEEKRRREIAIQDSLKLVQKMQFYKKKDNTTLKGLDAEQILGCIMYMSQDSVRSKLKHLKHELSEYSDVFYIYSKHEGKKIPLEVNYREAAEDKKKRVSSLEFISRGSFDPYQGWGLSPSEKVWLKFWEQKFKDNIKKDLKNSK